MTNAAPAAAARGLAFAGAARRLTNIDVARAAQALRCEVAAVRAVCTVEAGGAGFLPDNRPVILFEAHRFSKETGGRFDRSHPQISVPAWDRSLYQGGAREYDRLAAAVALDRSAALRASSWGLFQILGSNHELAGYPDVEGFVAGMTVGEGQHLDAFVSFCRVRGLDAHLRSGNWAAFARSYNGTAYAANRYDLKLADAYRSAIGLPVKPLAALRIGAKGEAVAQLQRALTRAGFPVVEDGFFGRATEYAVEKLQQAKRLAVDGIAGPQTWAILMK
jgi:hypothetical protein